MKLTNEEGYSLSIAVWLGMDDYNHSPVPGLYISATGLLKPIRMIVLDQRQKAIMKQSPDEDTMDISRNVPSRLGTAIHEAIENAWLKVNQREDSLSGKAKDIMTIGHNKVLRALGHPDKVIQRLKVNPTEKQVANDPDMIAVYMEQRAYKKIGEYTIGGQFDFVGNGVLEDFKSMGVYGYMQGGKDEDQLLQGSIYRWLNPKIVTEDHMLIQQIFTDWSKLDATIKKARGYPQQRIVTKRLKLMSLEETDTWVKNRLQLINKAFETPENELPVCTKKELWQSDTSYKYYKNPASTKRSTKNFDNFPEAHQRLMKDKQVGIIKEMPGLVRRCGYCNAFDLCTQKDEYLNNGTLKMP